MKSWHGRPDNILLDSIKLTALMSFCFGVGLLASSIIGVGAGSQLAETINYANEPLSTSVTSGISGGTSANGDTNVAVTQISTTTPVSNTTSPTPGTSGSSSYITPSLSFVSTVPSVVSSDFIVTLNAISVYNPQLVIRGLNINKLIVLDPTSQQLPTVNFRVRFDQLPIGRYEIMAKGLLPPNNTTIEVVGSRFEILAPATVGSGSNVSTNTSSGTVSTTTSTVYNSGAGTVSSSTINTTDDDSSPGVTEDDDEVEIPELDIIIPNQLTFKGFVPVQVRTTVSLPEAFIYLQLPNFSTPRFVGKARYYDNSTLLLLIDTNQLPNGEHRIYALAKLVDVNVESEKRRFVIDNSTTTLAITNSPISTTTNPIASTTLQPMVTTEPVGQPVPAIVEPSNQPAPVAIPPKIVPKENDYTNDIVIPKTTVDDNDKPKLVSLTDEMKALLPLVLKEYESEINQRLKVFGEDLHAEGIDIGELRKIAEEDLMSILIEDYRLRSISSEAKKRLRTEVERLVARAEKFELLIKKSEVTTESLDELVKTLKSEASTSEEVLVDTSSPREFGLVREDILQIESVSPIVSIDTISTSTKVYTEIRGRAVPNSLVTLYIYSTPVMVTVKADSDGTFTYIYEKDLANGDHEVYVALTTTEGEVVVKSPGFQFIREAQAFNSPDSSNGDNLVPATAGTPLTQNPYFIVISITLLVLSFVFFLLGFRTGNKSDDYTMA